MKPVRFDVELIVAGRDVLEGEVSFCVGDGRADHGPIGVSASETAAPLTTAPSGSFTVPVTLPLRVLAERDKRHSAREKIIAVYKFSHRSELESYRIRTNCRNVSLQRPKLLPDRR